MSWRLSSMTTPHAITTFGGAAGGTDAWGRGVNVLVSETRPTLGDVNLQRLWIGVDEVDEKDKDKEKLKLQVVPPRGWVEGGRTYVEEEALPGSEKAVAPTMEATKGQMETETETETTANVDDKATEDPRRGTTATTATMAMMMARRRRRRRRPSSRRSTAAGAAASSPAAASRKPEPASRSTRRSAPAARDRWRLATRTRRTRRCRWRLG